MLEWGPSQAFMDHRLQQFIHELATASIVGLFDPNPIGWTAQHEQDVRRVRRAIETATDQTTAKFKTPVNRNGFLLGCLDLTEHEPVEHLILRLRIPTWQHHKDLSAAPRDRD